MFTFRKKNLKIFGIMLACIFYMQCSCMQIHATETGQPLTSTDAYLNTFSVTPGTITPDFSPEVTGYMIAVADDVEQVNVVCSPMNASATVTEAKGFKNLQKGNNSAHITIKAPDGTTCTYNFNIIRGGASNGAPTAASDPASTADSSAASAPTTPAVSGFPFGAGSEANSALSLKIASAVPTTPAPAAPEPTVTEPETTAPEMTEPETAETETTEESTVEEPSESDVQEPEPPENTDGEQNEPYADTEPAADTEQPAVETMAPVSGSGERYRIGGDSIYADYYIRASFDASSLPAEFVVEPYSFEGSTVQSAYFAAGDIRLVYAEAEDGNNGRLRLYYEDDKTVLDFVPFYQANGYVFPVRYQAQIPVPQNYTGSYMPFEKEVVSCYIYTELTNNKLSVPEGMESKDTLQPGESTADADPVDVSELDETPEFYLFYGMSSTGKESFYLYDWVEGTCQRYVERDTSYDLDQSYFKYKDMAHRRFAVMCATIVLLLISVFIIINLFLKNKELKRDLEGYDPDEDSDEDTDEEYEGDEDEDDTEESEDDGFEMIDLSAEGNNEDGGYEDETYEEEAADYAEGEYPEEYTEEEYAQEDYDENDTSEEDWSEEEPVKPVHEEPKKPSVGLTLSDFENSLRLDTEEDSANESESDKKEAEAPTVEQPDQSAQSIADSKDIRPTEFKMINLSRDPEPNGIDDDFEFEFIKFDDN